MKLSKSEGKLSKCERTLYNLFKREDNFTYVLPLFLHIQEVFLHTSLPHIEVMPRVKQRTQKLGRSPKVAPTPKRATTYDVSSSHLSDNAGHGGRDAPQQGASSKGPSKQASKGSSKGPSKQAKVNPPSQSKKRRRRPGTVALREIRKYQKSEHLLIPRATFA